MSPTHQTKSLAGSAAAANAGARYLWLAVAAIAGLSEGRGKPDPSELCPREWAACQSSQMCPKEFDQANRAGGAPESGSPEMMALARCLDGPRVQGSEDAPRRQVTHSPGARQEEFKRSVGPQEISQQVAHCPTEWGACRASDGCEAEFAASLLSSSPPEIETTALLALVECVKGPRTFTMDAESGIRKYRQSATWSPRDV